MVLGAIVGGAIFATAMHLLGATGGVFAGFITGIVLGNLIASEEE